MTAATITILGRLGRDPEVKAAGQSTVCKLSLAVTNRDKSTTWFSGDCWGAQGDTIARYAKKGDLLYVSGAFAPREYQGKNGVAVSYDVNVTSFAFAGGKKDDAPEPYAPSSRPGARPATEDDDVPF